MKLTNPPSPEASARQAPPSPKAGHGGASPYDDGVVHLPHDDGTGYDDLHNLDVAHEHADVNVRAVVVSAVVLTAVVVVSQVLMLLLFNYFESLAAASDPPVSPVARPATQMPRTTNESPYFSQGVEGPQLLSNEPLTLQRQRAEEQKRLQGYGWVNQPAGVANIPIDEAKKLTLERGLPVREGAAPAIFATRPWVRGESSGGRTITIEPPEPQAAVPGQAPAPAPDHGTTPPGPQPPAAKPHNPGGH